jgi:DNA repair exonuclease SbcCD ATPase subunit
MPVDIYNEHCFETIHLDKDGEVVEHVELEGKRIRVIDTHGLPKHILKETLSNIRKNGTKSLTFVSKKAQNVQKTVKNKAVNIRNKGVQRHLLADFLSSKALSSEQLKTIYELNDEIDTQINQSHLARNTTWSIKSFKWSGLFNYYGESSVDFHSFRGLIGIFGKNYTGKSSIIDSFLFTIFGTTSKKERKLVDVLNDNSKKGFGEVEIQCDGKIFTIRRELKRVTRKGVDAATSTVNFFYEKDGKTMSLNGTTRVKTDKEIQAHFGSYEDFAMSSLASQTDSLNFIKEGSTKRKQIVASFLDLDHFEKKVKAAKEEASGTKALIKKLSSRNLAQSKQELAEQISAIKGKLKTLESGIKYTMTKKQIEYYKTLGSAQQRVEILKAEHQELKELERKSYLYDCYIEAVNTNGIPYQIIQEKIPVINQEIASFLVGVVEFDIYFECNNKSLDIFIKHPERSPKPIEMASGAEKTMASMAIRLALLSVSSLPKVDLFILDEPGTALDEDNLSGFIDILELIKMNFSTTLLISHLQSLKDSVDKEITIQNTNKGAKVL